MFCPKCRAEYREGFLKCADCDIELVGELAELPPEPKLEFIDYEEVFSTYNPTDIAMIKSVLESEDITYFFKGEHFTYMRPLADPARLMVMKGQAEDARNLLADLNLSFVGINLHENPKENKDQDF